MLMKKVSYNMKKSYLLALLALAPVFTACEKDDPVDPTKAEIEKLIKELAIQANQLRTSIQLAKTQPYDIGGTFDNNFNEQATKLGLKPVKNIVDSAKVCIPVGTIMMDFYKEYSNPENMTKMVNNAETVVATNKRINELQR